MSGISYLYILHHVLPFCKRRSQEGSISINPVLKKSVCCPADCLRRRIKRIQCKYVQNYLHPPHPSIVAVIASVITVALIARTKACNCTSRSFLPLMSGKNYHQENGSDEKVTSVAGW